jgi:small subunit ribosomal protein S4
MVKKKNRITRRFGEDIWGTVISKGFGNVYKYLMEMRRWKNFNTSYRVDIGKPRIKRVHLSSYGRILYWRRKLCLFYGGLRTYKFKNIERFGAKRLNFLEDVVGFSLERRLCTMLYRMNFASSIEESKKLIRLGYVLVNKEVILYPEKQLNVGDVIDLADNIKKLVYANLCRRVILKKIFKVPHFFEINYKLLSGLIYTIPKFSEIPYTFAVKKKVFISDYFGKMK